VDEAEYSCIIDNEYQFRLNINDEQCREEGRTFIYIDYYHSAKFIRFSQIRGMKGGSNNVWKRVTTSFMLAILVAFSFSPFPIAHGEESEGYYEMDYEVLSADDDSVSVANDYFDKPATLIVENGERTMQISINHSEWVVGLQAPQGDDFVDVDVVSQDDTEDTRIVEFKIEEDHDWVDPVEMKMHIIVDVLEEDYDHHYTARFAFDPDSMTEVSASEVEDTEESESANEDQVDDTEETDEDGKNTETDDSEIDSETEEIDPAGMNPGTLIVLVLLAAITVILLYAFVFKRKNNNNSKENKNE